MSDELEPRAFIPARIRDNPAVIPEEYISSLKHLPPVLLERLMNGDWTIMPTGLIKAQWIRYFTMRDKLLDLLITTITPRGDIVHGNDVLVSFHEQECKRFITLDTAGGSKQITAEQRGKPKSWTSLGVWDHKHIYQKDERGVPQPAGQALLLRHVWRARASFTEVADQLLFLTQEWNVPCIRVEDKTMGPDLCDLLQFKIPISVIGSGSVDKVVRNAPFQNMMKLGQVYLPKYDNTWRQTYESEILSWTGSENEPNDQIDMSSYAAIECGRYNVSGSIAMDTDPRKATPISNAGLMSWGAVPANNSNKSGSFWR